MAGSSQHAEHDLLVRRAHAGDTQRLASLISQQHDTFKHQFGVLPVRQLVETAYLTLVAEVQGSVVAFASLTDLPAVHNLDASVAVEYLQRVQPEVLVTVSCAYFVRLVSCRKACHPAWKCGS